MKRIIIADDHAVVRYGLKRVCLDLSKDNIISEVENGNELLRKLHLNEYDLVLLDMNMPGRDGLEILKEVKHNYSNLPVLIFSMNPEKHFAIRSIRAGASGYLNKENNDAEIRKAIELVLSGEKYLSPRTTELLLSNFDDDPKRPLYDKLKDREFHILRLIASGHTTAQIAQELYISPNTVTSYRRNILDKLGKKNNAELTMYAIENDLIE